MKTLGLGNRKNLAGIKIKDLRKSTGLTQVEFAAKLQVEGYPIEQKAVSRMESGQRIIPDYELPVLAKVLKTTINKLLE